MLYHRAVVFLAVCGLSLIIISAQDCTTVYVSNQKGELKSPNFPSRYDENSCMEWKFHMEQGNVATLSFKYLDLPEEADTGDCFSNYIEIRSSSSSSQRVICGEYADPYISPADETRFTVFFFAGEHPAGHGFKISYMIERGNHHFILPFTPRPTTTLAPTTMPTTRRPSLYQDFLDHKDCHEVLRNRTGWIQHSVRRGQRGPQTCRWLIQLPNNVDRITLMFKQMRHFLSDDDGGTAYIAVYEGSDEYSHSLGTFTGRNDPWAVTSHSRSMLVVFHMQSASAPRDVVFSAEYYSQGYERPSTTSRPSECYYRLSLSQGNFTMPPPPYNVRDVRDCQWHIYKPYISASDPVIHLIFTSLFLQDGASVLVFDGQDKWAPVLKRFNGSEHVSKPMSLWSTGRDLLVKFTAPPYSLENRPLWIQFRATYHFEENCDENKEINCGVGDNRCYSREQHCDGVWDCPTTGADERGCYGCSADMYSCNDFAHLRGDRGCYSLHERCSGESTCRNHADESNCDSNMCSYAQEEFLCANHRCIRYESVCNGNNDCSDGSDEQDCKDVEGSRYIIVWAVGGSLLGGLLLVLSVGIACKVYALRHNQVHPHPHHHHRGSRYDTPLSRMQAEMFRRRAPPPPYHEAMLTSRPYDEAVREYLAQQSQLAAAAEQESRSAEQSNGTGESAEPSDRSVHNLINLMDFEEVDEHRQPLGDAQGRLEIRVTEEASSDSNSDDEYDVEGEEGDHLAEDGSGHIEMSETLGRGRAASSSRRTDSEETESILLENISQDSASATVSADSLSLAEETEQDSDKDDEEPKVDGDEGGDDDSHKDSASDADSVCILCLDSDQDPAADEDGTDTRCLVLEV